MKGKREGLERLGSMMDLIKTLFPQLEEDRLLAKQGFQDLSDSVCAFGRELLNSAKVKAEKDREEMNAEFQHFLSDPSALFQSSVRKLSSIPFFVYSAKLELSLLDSALNPFRKQLEESGWLEGLRYFVSEGEKAIEENRIKTEAERKKNLELLNNGEKAVLTESHLNSLFREKIKNLPIRDLDISLESGKAEIRFNTDIKTKILGKSVDLSDVKVEICVKVEIEDGKVRGRLEKLSADGIPAKIFSSFFKETLSRHLEPLGILVSQEMNLDDLSWLSLPKVQDLEIDDGRLLLKLFPE